MNQTTFTYKFNYPDTEVVIAGVTRAISFYDALAEGYCWITEKIINSHLTNSVSPFNEEIRVELKQAIKSKCEDEEIHLLTTQALADVYPEINEALSEFSVIGVGMERKEDANVLAVKLNRDHVAVTLWVVSHYV